MRAPPGTGGALASCHADAATAVASSGAPDAPAFERLRILAAAAYYTTPAGFSAIGFVGNVPRTSFDGPPQAVLDHLAAELRKLD